MGPESHQTEPSGLRERKKLRTRENIEKAALTLFEAAGYDQTTIADIAAAAEVAPRTIFAYFESKDDIIFWGDSVFYKRLDQVLTARSPGETTVDALRTFLSSSDTVDAQARRRRRIIAASNSLRASERARSAPLERILSASIATDLHSAPDDIRPHLAAAAITVAFTVARNRRLEGSEIPLTHEQTLQVLELVLTFLHGGLEAFRSAI